MQVRSITGNSAGAMNGDGSRKALLHSTEGDSIDSAVSAYRANNSWPHRTVDLKRRIVAEHLPLDVAARSLQNLPGGADQTNKDGTVLIQYELVGSATNPSSIGSRADLEWFGREVLGPDCRAMGIPLVTTVRWIAYRSTPPSSYGTNNGVRLSPAEWDAYSGVLAHMHAPDNVHGDTGALDIDTILAAARGEDDPMSALTDDEQRELLRNSRTIRDRLADSGDIGRRSKETTIGMRALLKREDLDEAEVARQLAPLVLAGMPVDDIATAVVEALPDDQAQAFLDALAVRLGN